MPSPVQLTADYTFRRLLLLSILGVLLGSACSSGGGGGPIPSSAPTPKPGANPTSTRSSETKQWSSAPAMSIDTNKQYLATISTSAGEMQAELFVKDAPNTVNNFVFLARQGFYNNVPFHRIISGFMIQTGDPTGTGRGGPGYRFNDELPRTREYEPGTLAMANAGPNTQGSQFFICHGDLRSRLPKNYTIFGKLTSGSEVLDSIGRTPVGASPSGENSVPTQDVHIRTVTIQES